jgi:hypothetical protein
MNCQTPSWALSSGHFGGNGMIVILSGTVSLVERCQPAWSSNSATWRPGCDVGRDRGKMPVHHRRVAPRQDQADGLALLGADGAEDVSGGGALV